MLRRSAWLFAVALALRLLFVRFYAWTSFDNQGYVNIATNLMAGHGFSRAAVAPFEPTLFRTPVYPAFLVGVNTLFGAGTTPVYLVQALVGAVACVLIYMVGRRYFDDRTAYLGGVLSALSPFAARYVPAVLTETLTIFLLAAASLAWARAHRDRSFGSLAATGALLGVAILCRPEWMFLPLCALVCLVAIDRSRGAWREGGLVLAFAFLAVLPWLVRDYAVVGHFVPLIDSNPAEEFWKAAHPAYDHDAYQFAPGTEKIDPVVAESFTVDTEEARRRFQPTAWRAGLAQIADHPLGYAKSRVRAYAHLWMPSGDFLLGDANRSFGDALRAGQYGLVASKAILLIAIGVAPFVLGLLGLYWSRGRLIERFPLWIIPLYISVARAPFDIEPRHALPAQPYLLLFAAFALAHLVPYGRLAKIAKIDMLAIAEEGNACRPETSA